MILEVGFGLGCKVARNPKTEVVSKEVSVVVRCGSSHGHGSVSCVGSKERRREKCVGVTKKVWLVPVGAAVEPVSEIRQ
jgi:hypothetical protein